MIHKQLKILWPIVSGLAALLFCPSPTCAADAPQLRVAVLEFGNASSESGLEALGKGLQSMVTTDLSRVSTLTLVERSRLQEIVAEQKLSNSGLIDKTTAAKIGKLAGATHLLGGTFTVVGKNMRLDARLFSVKTGEVLLAEDMAGERDAFFELEKAMVNKLITALGIKLDPKERAGIAKIHTADFGAFKIFSQGVAHFDQQRYDEAFDSLRAAMKIDGDFNLARVTLQEYEAVVAKIRLRAQSIEATTRKLDLLKKDQVFENDSQVAQRLVEIASVAGSAATYRRLAALTFLVGFYDPHGRNHGRISRFQDHFDTLVVRRRVDVLVRRYFAESQAIFPDAPLFVFGHHPPDTPQEVDKRVDGLAGALKQGLEHQKQNRDQGLANNLAHTEEFVALMGADKRERIALLELASAKLGALGADVSQRTRLLEQLADAYLDVGDVDAASGAFARESAIETDPSDLKQLATKIEELGKLAALFARTDKKAELRELIAAGERHPASLAKLFEQSGPPSLKLLRELADRRELKRWWSYQDPFWLWSGEPAHLILGEYVAFTGPRVDGMASKSVRYYHPQNMSTKDVLIAVGRGHRAAFEADFELQFVRPADFSPKHVPREVVNAADIKLDPGRPEVTFLFGLHDIDTSNEQNPETHKNFYPAPTQSFGVRFMQDSVSLVQIGEVAPSAELHRSEMTIKILARESKGVDGDSAKVHVAVKGKEVSVKVGGTTYHFALPSIADGFVGAHFRGVGFVALADLRLK